MAIKSFPLNQNSYSYNAQDVCFYYVNRKSGVFGVGTNCQVSITNAMDVKVSKGKGWLAHEADFGLAFWLEEDVHLNVPIGDSIYNRWDYICVGCDISAKDKSPSVYVKSGTPATVPDEPTLENNSNKVEICLAKIYVPAGTTSLVSGNIKFIDTREDSGYCGLVGDDREIGLLEDASEKLSSDIAKKSSDINFMKNSTISGGNNIGQYFSGERIAKKTDIIESGGKINNTYFDGSKDINTIYWGNKKNISIGGTKSSQKQNVTGGSDINIVTTGVTMTRSQANSNYQINGVQRTGDKFVWAIDKVLSSCTYRISKTSVRQLIIKMPTPNRNGLGVMNAKSCSEFIDAGSGLFSPYLDEDSGYILYVIGL